VHDIVLTVVGGEDSTPHVLWERLVDIQEGRVKWEGWDCVWSLTLPERPQF